MSKITPIFLSIHFFTLLLSLLTYANSQLYDQEQEILLRLKQHWRNQPVLDQWTPSTSSSYCTWPGVNCNSNNSSIVGLGLANMSISGTIPPFICDLKNLTVVNFYNNSFTGTFPVSLFNCSKLEYLDLAQNYFVGKLPDDIDRLSRLSYLNLYANNFTGNVPVAIGRLQELRNLQLQQNQFNGTFPSEIGELFNLEVLYMAYNSFLPSKLPSTFTQLKKLKELWFSNSNLIGEIPDMIGEMVALERLDLSGNELSGKIPSSLLMLKNLSVLYLYKNQLYGEIPHVVEALNLTVIDLSDNNLIGTIPDDFGKLTKLSDLRLFFNQLSGEIPEGIARLPAIKDILLFSNNLSGLIPQEFGRHSMLETFEVASNRFTGKLPEFLCSNGKLVGLVAFDSSLSGPLPESLGNCSSLLMLHISNNAFSGNIPVGLWQALNMSFFMISDNLFTGELPTEVSRNLRRLEISNNRFSGKIPTGDSWRNLVVFNASNNQLSGTIPQELTALPFLTTLLLDRNQLSGAIPSDIISWKSLNTLNLSRNQLSGEIPGELALLPTLLDLDLSDNQFSGHIPTQFSSPKFNLLNLSSNHLSGEIPATASVLSLLLSFLIIRVHQKKKCRLNSTWKFTSFQKLSFTESDILSQLTESNLIGTGGSGKVHRVAISRSGDFVAVKRILSERKLEQKLEKQFEAEVEILSRIRHLNIVKLLCCICNDDSKLLVYEYMEKRSLDQWLHVKKRSVSVYLDWPTRFRIAIGAAQGLSYLHHDCLPPIIHRDVKSSNILLDSSFNAKIADFGLARLLVKHGKATVSTVAGSFGYIAPEYAVTSRVNEKTDVYSFGVVLLELTTRKEANFGDENTCLTDWARLYMNEGKAIVDALDKEIKEASYLDEMTIVFKLGVRCTSKSPSARPSMREVLQILVRCRNPLAYGLEENGRENDDAPLFYSKQGQMPDSDDNLYSHLPPKTTCSFSNSRVS
ncbi:hypothetical protein JCGZ_07370 [Jatropha curcas]|uniref:Protein kinase domain-containing protein n=1 Tax=Jatropha curcas TaxID=180498 RepID=A0A067KPS0_JATCU|nr:hypothetical protein JCGZ_07370 [Jatropha curcas]